MSKSVLFPDVDNNDVKIIQFLEASNEIIQFVEDLGILFKPLSNDMSNNVAKIAKCNGELCCETLGELLVKEKESGLDVAAESLLWLKRGLHFICEFFNLVASDDNEEEDLQCTMEAAYKVSLQPHHGWMTQQLFRVLRKAAPSRTTMLEITSRRMCIENDLISHLKIYCHYLAENIRCIDYLFERHALDSNRKVL